MIYLDPLPSKIKASQPDFRIFTPCTCNTLINLKCFLVIPHKTILPPKIVGCQLLIHPYRLIIKKIRVQNSANILLPILREIDFFAGIKFLLKIGKIVILRRELELINFHLLHRCQIVDQSSRAVFIRANSMLEHVAESDSCPLVTQEWW